MVHRGGMDLEQRWAKQSCGGSKRQFSTNHYKQRKDPMEKFGEEQGLHHLASRKETMSSFGQCRSPCPCIRPRSRVLLAKVAGENEHASLQQQKKSTAKLV